MRRIILAAALMLGFVGTPIGAHDEPVTETENGMNLIQATNHCNSKRSHAHDKSNGQNMNHTECFCWHYGLWASAVAGQQAYRCAQWISGQLAQ